MRYFTFICLLLPIIVKSQDSIPDRPPPVKDVVVYIKGHPYEKKVDSKVFESDFELECSDPSYKVARFRLSWTDGDGTIYVVPVIGSRVIPANLKYPLEHGMNFLAFDQVIVRKPHEFFRATSFVVTPVDAMAAAEYTKDLARCVAMVNGNASMAAFTADDFQKDLEVRLTDNSYKLVSFELVTEINDKLASTVITGSTISLDKDDVTRSLRTVIPGSVVTLEKIKVVKNGVEYKVAGFPIYVK